MHQMNVQAAISLVLIITSLASNAQSQAKPGKATSTEPCPDQKTYTGKYRNWGFGFSIIIPAGLKGYWNSARCVPDEKVGCVCMGDHGRFIPLSDQAHIEAFVGYEMEPEWSAIEYENDEIASLRREQEIKQVNVLRSRWIRMGRLRARRFAVQYIEKNQDVMMEHIIALYQGVEYELIFRTLADRYQTDRKQFEKVIASWRLARRIR